MNVFIIEKLDKSGESYAVTQDETESKWLIIRKRADEETGHSPLVGTADTLPAAFAQLGALLERPVH